MRTESRIFNLPAIFFVLAGVAYGVLSHWEMVGTTCIILTGGLAFMIGIYFSMLARRHGTRPEDDSDGEIAALAGEQGVYAPWSWWPLVLAASAALAFLGLAIQWWIFAPALLLGVVGLQGWVFEFSRGQHAH